MIFGSVCSGKSRTGRPAIDLLGQRFGRLPAELRLVLDYMEGRR